jgi:hypothetical protein
VSSTSCLATARETTGVLIPSYEMVPGAILKAVEDASSIVAGATDEGGEYLSTSLVESMLAANVPDGSIVILPLTPPTFQLPSKHMFIRIHIRPQLMHTYGQCNAYSDGTEERLVPVGTPLNPPKYLVYVQHAVRCGFSKKINFFNFFVCAFFSVS